MMNSIFDDLFIKLDATAADLVIVAMGCMVVAVMVIQDRRHSREMKMLWDKLHDANNKYAALNAWTYGASVAIRVKTGINLLKQSADGKGETALNRDV